MSGKSNDGNRAEQSEPKNSAAMTKPRCAYFYYLEPKTPTHAHVTAFIASLKANDDIDTLVPGWITEAKTKTYTSIIPVGLRFSDVRWCRLSYIVIAADDKTFKIEDVDITFDNGTSAAYTIKNKSPIPGLSEPRSGVRYLNDITKMIGGKWDPESKYNELFDIEIKLAKWRESGITILSHDSTGTNMGPPIGPP